MSNSNGADRVPPHDAEAEAALLGAMLLDRDVITDVGDQASADEFYVGAHQVIFEAIAALAEGCRQVGDLILQVLSLRLESPPRRCQPLALGGRAIDVRRTTNVHLLAQHNCLRLGQKKTRAPFACADPPLHPPPCQPALHTHLLLKTPTVLRCRAHRRAHLHAAKASTPSRDVGVYPDMSSALATDARRCRAALV